MENTSETVDQEKYKTTALVVYALYGASFFVGGLTAIVGIIIAYMKRTEAAGTYIASHFNYQIRTFWWTVLWSVVGFVTSFIVIGFVILVATAIWFIYRIVKGFLRLQEKEPIA